MPDFSLYKDPMQILYVVLMAAVLVGILKVWMRIKAQKKAKEAGAPTASATETPKA